MIIKLCILVKPWRGTLLTINGDNFTVRPSGIVPGEDWGAVDVLRDAVVHCPDLGQGQLRVQFGWFGPQKMEKAMAPMDLRRSICLQFNLLPCTPNLFYKGRSKISHMRNP